MNKTFFDYYGRYAQETPDKVLLRIDENTLTYREFMEKTAQLGSGMQKLGIRPDDKVGIIMPNSIDWYLVRSTHRGTACAHRPPERQPGAVPADSCHCCKNLLPGREIPQQPDH